MVAVARVRYAEVEGAKELFTPQFLEYLLAAHDKFGARVHQLRAQRDEMLQRALKQGVMPTHLPRSRINTGAWSVPPVPEDLKKPGIEISGPVSITNMAINALNPYEGERAEGYLDDDEDSGGHRLIDTVMSARNRLAAVERTLSYYNPERRRQYELQPGELPFFMHRERSLALDEHDVTIDGKPVSATILGLCLTLYYAGRAQVERGQGVYFYLPKMELVEEAQWYRDFFDFSRQHLGYPENAVIRAIPLVESLPMVYIMEETLHALGPYAAGLNAARWDLKASILEYVMADPKSVWPDRFGVDIKQTDFLANIFRRLVAICLKRGAVPIGGMATALPSRDEEVNKAAAAAIRNDKVWEANQGFLRGWVAHIFHMKTAADPFRELRASGWTPSPEMAKPESYPIEIKVPQGPITVEGTRRNARMLIEYVEGWLNGRGAKGIDSLEGKPGVHPALMEDLATGRISVAQMAQRILHKAKDTNTGQAHDFALAKRLLQEELEDILKRRRAEFPEGDEKAQAAYKEVEARYRKAYKIALRWIKNYTELNFRSLGSYTRADLDKVAASPDAF
jgi:malate synthase